MNIVYMCLESGNKINKFSLIKNKLKNFFGIFDIKNIDNKKIIIFPYNKKINFEKYLKKIKKKIFRQNTVIIFNNEELEEIKKNLILEKYEVLNNNYLFSHMVLNIIQYIAEKQRKKIEEYNISILANERTKQNINQIIKLSR